MAKALYGAAGYTDIRAIAEIAALRARVTELEAELAELRESSVTLIALPEPALT